MNRRHQLAQCRVDEPVLVDEPEALERWRAHADVEVVARASRIDDFDMGSRDAALDTTTHLIGADHRAVGIRRGDLEQARRDLSYS